MLGEQEQQQQLVPGTEPWEYRSEVEMLNGHNGDVPPQPVLPVVEELETDVVHTVAVPSGLGDVTQEDPAFSSRPHSTTGTLLSQRVLMRKLESV